ncbi:hypothetical protein EG329_011424 [Mollisiaceae sp. DMI_Dod_QoI]|nr:hypothetical protein EG329_011424 [Helotiales sp. DMI_Dod_QoI]
MLPTFNTESSQPIAPGYQRRVMDFATTCRLFGGRLPTWLGSLVGSIYNGAANSMEMFLASITIEQTSHRVEKDVKPENIESETSWQEQLKRCQERSKAGGWSDEV